MKGKIIKLLTLLMVASLFLAACGGGATEAPAPAEPAEPAATWLRTG
jgi:ABC-type glycerol-3-phosphate transport system substrate-binding protein